MSPAGASPQEFNSLCQSLVFFVEVDAHRIGVGLREGGFSLPQLNSSTGVGLGTFCPVCPRTGVRDLTKVSRWVTSRISVKIKTGNIMAKSQNSAETDEENCPENTG